MRHYDEPGLVYQMAPAAELTARRRDASLDAAHFGTCARFAIHVVVERSQPDHPLFGVAVDLFEADAYKAAVRAARIARMRIDLDPLTPAQQRMLDLVRRMTKAQGDWTPKSNWVQWWDLINEWQKAPVRLGTRGANLVWNVLLSRDLVEHHPDDDSLVRAAEKK